MARLRPLSERENTHPGDASHDARGWPVRTRVDDEEIGTVHDVLLDEEGRARYLDVDVDDGRHVLIPSGDAWIDSSDEVVHVSGLDREGLGTLPDYDHGPETVTPEYSRSLTTAYDAAYSEEHDHDRADYSSRWSSAEGRGRSGTLGRLDELDDVEVADHDPDPRGWDVVGADGSHIGRVDHIIGDTGTMKARYLTVELDEEIHEDRHVLLPVGHVDLDTDGKRVVSRGLHRERVTALPAYEGGTIDRGYETRVRKQYEDAYEDERLYDHPRYRSRLLGTETEPRRR